MRAIMHHCFGGYTGSIYDERSIGERYCAAIGAPPEDMTYGELQDAAAKVPVLVKTHEKPPLSEPVPTVVIVRDGRRACGSLKAFFRERNGIDCSMEDVIRGNHTWGGWSQWVEAWSNAACGPVMWLRYEDTMNDLRGTVDALAKAFNLTPISYELPDFESLHAARPGIFRKADMEGNGGMTQEEEALFWVIHGPTMEKLRYARS